MTETDIYKHKSNFLKGFEVFITSESILAIPFPERRALR